MNKKLQATCLAAFLAANALAAEAPSIEEAAESRTTQEEPLELSLTMASFTKSSGYSDDGENKKEIYGKYTAGISYKPHTNIFATATIGMEKPIGDQYSKPSQLDYNIRGGYTTGPVDLFLEYEKDRTLRDGADHQTFGAVGLQYKFAPEIFSKHTEMQLTAKHFAYNKNFHARPDDSGKAFMGYTFGAATSLYKELELYVEGSFLTDGDYGGAKRFYKASECDLTVQLSYVYFHEAAISLVRIVEMSLDKPVARQNYIGLQLGMALVF